jgi:GWxTD domain-containing protein
MKKTILLAMFITVLLSACAAGKQKINHDPYYESFFEKTRLIMTKEEVEIYKQLPDLKSKDEFIDEFWKKRDPVPETPENENKIEFENRIAYANRWFKENRPAGRGWDSARGRILLQLGEPDNRSLNDMLNNSQVKGYERWFYYEYNLELIFIDKEGFGEFKLSNWPVGLLTAIDFAKFTLNLVDRESLKKAFTFKAKYQDGQIQIEFPLKKIHFKEVENEIGADFEISVYVYRDYKKIDIATFTKQIRYEKDKIPTVKTLNFALPYPLPAKGRYYFDVIVKDMLTAARSRSFLSYKN